MYIYISYLVAIKLILLADRCTHDTKNRMSVVNKVIHPELYIESNREPKVEMLLFFYVLQLGNEMKNQFKVIQTLLH